MRPCDGDACEYADLQYSGFQWIAQNFHPTKSIVMEFDGVWGGTSQYVELKPGEQRVLSFTVFFGNWHANFSKLSRPQP